MFFAFFVQPTLANSVPVKQLKQVTLNELAEGTLTIDTRLDLQFPKIPENRETSLKVDDRKALKVYDGSGLKCFVVFGLTMTNVNPNKNTQAKIQWQDFTKSLDDNFKSNLFDNDIKLIKESIEKNNSFPDGSFKVYKVFYRNLGDLLSIIDISSDGTKRITDEFKLDGKRHLGAFGIIYSSQCNANESLKIAMRNIFVKAVAEYKITGNGMTILRNGEVIQTCTK